LRGERTLPSRDAGIGLAKDGTMKRKACLTAVLLAWSVLLLVFAV
jgi:hypothetical protein